MEYVPGGSLRFILDTFVKFKEKLVRSYTRQILLGLKACHDDGIWHGDLKVSNILIDDLGIVKLTDFGFIKQVLNNTSKVGHLRNFLKDETKEDDFENINVPKWGSEAYTPPEVVRDADSKLNPAYDIWSLGCCIVEMLSGKEPWYEFEGEAKAILKNLLVTKTQPTMTEVISEDWKSFLDNCFQINPKKRTSIDNLLKHPFVTMTEKEMKESLEASNFISFFSILASQKSLSDNGNYSIVINIIFRERRRLSNRRHRG